MDRIMLAGEDPEAAAASSKKEPIQIFQWLNTSECTKDKAYLEEHGYVIVQIFDDKDAENEVSDHILKAILDEAPEEKNAVFQTVRPGFPKKHHKHALVEYFKDLTKESHVFVNKEKKKIQKIHAEADEKFPVENIKVWTKNRIFHKLHLPSFRQWGWEHMLKPKKQPAKLSEDIQSRLEIFFKGASAQVEVLAYHASVPHDNVDDINLSPVNPTIDVAAYVGHLAATAITFCMLSADIKDISSEEEGTIIDPITPRQIKSQRVITIPAGCALIHDVKLRYVPLENMFSAIYNRHMWACTFQIVLGDAGDDIPTAGDASDDEEEAAKKAAKKVAKEAANNDAVHKPPAKRHKKEEEAAVGDSRLTYVPNEAYTQTGYSIIHPDHIPALEKHILQLEASSSGMNAFDKLNTEARIARAHQTLAHARRERDAQAS